jgi:hypothetical protein
VSRQGSLFSQMLPFLKRGLFMLFPFSQAKKLLFYVLLAIVLIATCIFSALLALKMANKDHNVTWTSTELAAHGTIITLDLPFPVADDPGFNVDPEIRFYVRNTKAFFGRNANFTFHMYSIAFRTEILESTWSPNIENMADITILALEKNKFLSNLAHQKRYMIINKIRAMEVASRYRLRGENYVQRVLHLPIRGSTWSLKATLRETDGATFEIATKIFRSIKLAAN